MARTKFATPEALIVISTDGYFDVYPSGERVANSRPAYRGTIDQLDRDVRAGNRLTVRPDSIALRVAVASWSSEHGAAAVRGDLGAGRNGKQVVPAT
jgi:hypothetical protein